MNEFNTHTHTFSYSIHQIDREQQLVSQCAVFVLDAACWLRFHLGGSCTAVSKPDVQEELRIWVLLVGRSIRKALMLSGLEARIL